MNALVSNLVKTLRDATDISLKLFRIMIPIIVAVKVLQEFGVVEVLASVLSPIMQVVGLPGSMGLVLATTMLANLYGGAIVFISLTAGNPLTVAQTTVLTVMMLLAHNLPVEMRIAQKAGVKLYATALLRIGGAFALGWCLHQVYSLGNWYQEANIIAWVPPAQDPGLTAWVLGQVRTFAMIFLIILGLLILLTVLDRLGITELMHRCLNPVLSLLGIGKSASNITIIGIMLGLAYGGGLIIREAQSEEVSKRDILFSLCLMGLSHSLVEDTLLTALLGGSLSGVLWARVAFSLLCIYILVKWISRMSDAAFYRYFFRAAS